MINIIGLGKKVMRAGLAQRGFGSAPLPLKLTIGLTYLCNSKCQMCSVWKAYRRQPGLFKSELDLPDYERLFSQVGELAYVEITGGEPFLKDILVEVVLAASETNRGLMAVVLTTNGLAPVLVARKVAMILSKLPGSVTLVVGVSLDGTLAVHDEMRGTKGAWKRAIETFSRLRSLWLEFENLRPHLCYTITRYNAGKMEEFYAEIRDELGLDQLPLSVSIEHRGLLYHTQGKSGASPATQDVWRDLAFASGLSTLAGSTRIVDLGRRSFYAYYLQALKRFVRSPDKMILPCAAATLSAYVSPYGAVYPCIVWAKKLGNLLEDDFRSIWNSERARVVRNLIRRGECTNCWTPCEAQSSWLLNLPWIALGLA